MVVDHFHEHRGGFEFMNFFLLRRLRCNGLHVHAGTTEKSVHRYQVLEYDISILSHAISSTLNAYECICRIMSHVHTHAHLYKFDSKRFAWFRRPGVEYISFSSVCIYICTCGLVADRRPQYDNSRGLVADRRPQYYNSCGLVADRSPQYITP